MPVYRESLISAGICCRENEERRGRNPCLTPNKCAITGWWVHKLCWRPVRSAKLQMVTCVWEIFKVSSQKKNAEDIKASQLRAVCSVRIVTSFSSPELWSSHAHSLDLLWAWVFFHMKANPSSVTHTQCVIVAVYLCSHKHGLYLMRNGWACNMRKTREIPQEQHFSETWFIHFFSPSVFPL